MAEEPFPLGAIPERLKCSICTALAREAWKLPCCDQIVCGTCYEALPNDACPICAFTPMQKDKCAPSTSLRTTIAVFLRHAEKRYKDALAKEAKINESKSDQMQVDTVGTPQTQEASTSIGNTNGQSDFGSGTPQGQQHNAPQTQGTQGPINDATNAQFGSAAIQQQQREYEKLYGPSASMPIGMGMGMGFNPMMSNFPMDPMNQMMMQQMAMSGGFGGFGGNGLSWNSGVQSYPQNMNMQIQESNFPDQPPPTGPSVSDYPSRGGFRGRYVPRGPLRGGRGGHQAHAIAASPVFVEGAPTGPSAMRNGTDSRGRGSRGRGSLYRGAAPRFVSDHDVDHRNATGTSARPIVDDHTTEPRRSRSKSKSMTRERSMSPKMSPRRNRARSRSISRVSRDRSPLHRPSVSSRTSSPLANLAGADRERDDIRKTVEPREPHGNRKEMDINAAPTTKSLADRIEKVPRTRSRSRSPRSDKHKSRRSSHKSRRRRSESRERSRDRDKASRARSRSGDRRERSRRDRSADREESRKHKRHRNVFEEEQGKESKSSRSRKSRDSEREKKSHRSNPKYEMGSPELRRLENERENARYR